MKRLAGHSGPPVVQVAVALGAVYVIWGSTYFAMRLAIESLPPLLMAGARFGIAGTLLFCWVRLRGAPSPTRTEWWAALPIGLLLPALGNGLVALAQQTVASSVAAVLVGSMPLWVVLIGAGFGVRPRWTELVGVALGTAGIVLLNFDGSLRASPLGALFLVLAPLSWALGSVWSRRLPLPPGAMASALQMIWGSLFLMFGSVAMGERVPQAMTLRSGLAFVYLIVAGSMIAYSAYGFLLRNVRPALATSYAYVNPVVALLIGWTLGAERLGGYGIAGTVVILAAVVLVATGRPKPPR